jgi:hypothetical protein
MGIPGRLHPGAEIEGKSTPIDRGTWLMPRADNHMKTF